MLKYSDFMYYFTLLKIRGVTCGVVDYYVFVNNEVVGPVIPGRGSVKGTL